MIDISIKNVVKSFEIGAPLLDGFSMELREGERVGLLGRNGCGKTTLFRMITGQLLPDEGEITVAAGKRIGLISQIPWYPEEYTVENVLRSAFAELFALKKKMAQLEREMAEGSTPAQLSQYDSLVNRYETGGGYTIDTAVLEQAVGKATGGRAGVARVRDDLDDADRAAHILQAHRAGHQIVQAQLHQLDKIQAVVPGHFQKAPGRLFLRGKLHPVELDLLAVHGEGLLLHRELGELDGLPVPAELQVKFARRVPCKEHGDVGVDIDALAVDLIEFIPGLQTVLGVQGAAVVKIGDDRRRKAVGRAEQDEHDEKARQEIHKRTGGENNEPPPGLGPGEGPGIVAVLVLPFHSAIAADGDQAQGIRRLAPGALQQGRAHADGKLIDLHPQELGCHKMPQLVDEDQKAEN